MNFFEFSPYQNANGCALQTVKVPHAHVRVFSQHMKFPIPMIMLTFIHFINLSTRLTCHITVDFATDFYVILTLIFILASVNLSNSQCMRHALVSCLTNNK